MMTQCPSFVDQVFRTRNLDRLSGLTVTVRPLTDDPSFLYKKLVRESCARNLYIQVAHRTIQVSRMGNMVEDRDDDLAVAAHP